MSFPRAFLGLIAIVVVLSFSAPVRAAENGTDVPHDCAGRLERIWANYTAINPACEEILETAVTAVSVSQCPPQANITSCFKVLAEEWEEYVEHCELFEVEGGSEAGESESEAEAGSPDSAPESEPEAGSPDAAPSPEAAEESDDEDAFAPAPGPSEDSDDEEGESPAESASAPEAAGEAENEAGAPEAESEAGATRRLFAEEAESSAGTSSVCFPKFTTIADFEEYLNDEFTAATPAPAPAPAPSGSATVGIPALILAGLVAIGFPLYR